MPELLFHGAAGEVTGSMHMVRVDDRWVALDCGLFQGHRADSEAKNRAWPMKPSEIEAVVVSHAHIDHTGRLPLLVKEGFDGPIYCTSATRDLCAVMLPDSAHIQEEDALYLNKRRRKQGMEPIEPLYGYPHAVAAIDRMRTTDHDRWFEVVPGLRGRYNEAGHMLGAAGIELAFANRNGHTPSLYFTGDVGRYNQPILRDPQTFPDCDVIICESTYGGRVNPRVEDAKEQLVAVVKRTHQRGGKVIIPAFSVGRTQTIVYFMHEQMVAGELPRRPIYIDSPLAVNATEVFRLHPECYDAEARSFHKVTGDILGGGCCTYVRSAEESKALNFRREACTIIAASGMCEAGRIRHHLKNNIENEHNTILIPGFQAEGTLGRRLVDGAREVSIFGESLRVRAEVVQLNGFSGHADQNELLHFLSPLASRSRRIFLVHGEPEQSAALKEKLAERGLTDVHVAERGQRVEV